MLEQLIQIREKQVRTLQQRFQYLTQNSQLAVSYTNNLTVNEQVKYCNVGIYCFLNELRYLKKDVGSQS